MDFQIFEINRELNYIVGTTIFQMYEARFKTYSETQFWASKKCVAQINGSTLVMSRSCPKFKISKLPIMTSDQSAKVDCKIRVLFSRTFHEDTASMKRSHRFSFATKVITGEQKFSKVVYHREDLLQIIICRIRVENKWRITRDEVYKKKGLAFIGRKKCREKIYLKSCFFLLYAL